MDYWLQLDNDIFQFAEAKIEKGRFDIGYKLKLWLKNERPEKNPVINEVIEEHGVRYHAKDQVFLTVPLSQLRAGRSTPELFSKNLEILYSHIPPNTPEGKANNIKKDKINSFISPSINYKDLF